MKVNRDAWNLSDESFGPLLEYIKDNMVTDINFNGKDVWVEHLRYGIYKAPIILSYEFVRQFCV